VAVYDLPLTVFFWPKNHRNPKRERGDLFPCSKLRLWVLYLHNVGKLRAYMLRYDLDANESTLSGLRCGMVDDLFNLIPPTYGRAIEGV
jgi:hypothetical protein